MLLLTPCAQDDYTALMRASLRGDPRVVRALLAAGADMEAKDNIVGTGGHG